mmetsp:Transcript_24793/g.56050  ORF Transcript_24793/g.56050 Transcript_24793/m.56050 type:complete len:122 (-) Transcript_24793:177-542(-)
MAGGHQARRSTWGFACCCVVLAVTSLTSAIVPLFLGPQHKPGKRKMPGIEAIGKDPAGSLGEIPVTPVENQQVAGNMVWTVVSVAFWAVFIRTIIIEAWADLTFRCFKKTSKVQLARAARR